MFVQPSRITAVAFIVVSTLLSVGPFASPLGAQTGAENSAQRTTAKIDTAKLLADLEALNVQLKAQTARLKAKYGTADSCRVWAMKGDTIAMNKLGNRYLTGDDVEKDPVEAVKWYRMSSAKGSPAGMFNLGRCYRDGLGVEQDLPLARKHYRMSAEQDDAYAMVAYGRMLRDGDGGSQDSVEAFLSFRRAASAGHDRALVLMGDCYRDGIGSKQNLEKAREFYRRAATKDEPDRRAAHELAKLLASGDGGVKDLAGAKEFFEIAADLGYSNSMIRLASIAISEGGVRNNPSAWAWIEKGVKAGHPCAMHMSGQVFQRGYFGQQVDRVAAERYYRQAVQGGCHHAADSLTEMGN